MESSRSSKLLSDPLSDVLSLLKLGNARCTRLEADGEWALHFPGFKRLKFVAVLRGYCRIEVPGFGVNDLHAGQSFLLTDAPYIGSSGPDLPPQDGAELYANTDVVRLGGDTTVMLGGGFTLEGSNASFFIEALPGLMIINADDPGAKTLSAVLGLLEREMERSGISQSFLMRRLADILLVESLRAYIAANGATAAGWIGALSDAQVGRALVMMHADPGRRWRVEALATAVGMSRSAFAQKFKRLTGAAPLEYLRRWRMWIAQAAVEAGDASVGKLAADLGYESESAFGAAFKRVNGRSPRQVRHGRQK